MISMIRIPKRGTAPGREKQAIANAPLFISPKHGSTKTPTAIPFSRGQRWVVKI